VCPYVDWRGIALSKFDTVRVKNQSLRGRVFFLCMSCSAQGDEHDGAKVTGGVSVYEHLPFDGQSFVEDKAHRCLL
jgi:hypothetical protein